MTKFLDLARPEMSAAAGFHDDDGHRQLREERQDLVPTQPGVVVETARAARNGQLEDGLCDVDANQGILHLDSSLYCLHQQRLWHIDADRVEGGVHRIIEADTRRRWLAPEQRSALLLRARGIIERRVQLNAVLDGPDGPWELQVGMANGKPGDHPLNDICDYGLPRFSPKADALVREIHEYLSRQRMSDLFDWFSPPPLPELEKRLELKRDELRRDAAERGWEPK